jgi:hemolysin activation/secretion protein
MPQRSKLVWPPVAAAGLLAVSVLPTAVLAQAPFGAAPGQTTGLLPPKLPPTPAAPTITPPPVVAGPGAASGQPGAVLLPSLKGLVFVSGSRALNPDGVGEAAAGPAGVAVSQLPILNDPKFVALMKAHLGKPLRLADLEQIRAQTRAWYVARRHPFVDVVAPPQNINAGVVQMVVSEYQLGKVEVVGAHYFKNSLILQPVDLKPGQKIDLPQLQDNLARLNENPFLSVDAEFRPGEEPATTDLVLRAKDRLPLRVYAGYDNQGVPTLDTREWNAGVNWGNAFGTGQILSYQYTRAVNGRFASHSASDVIRVDNTDKILVFGNYAILRSASFLGPFQFDSNGHSTQASFRWVHTLPKLFGDSLTGHVQLGYDFKSTDNNAFFDQFQLGPPSVMETSQFPVVYDGAEADRFGSTAIENDLVFAPGRLTSRDNDADFQTLVAGARARYVYDRLSVTRTERLPQGVSLIARVIVQRSSAILPNSEQLGGGGVGSVRGYSPDTGLGSNGELASVELRAPAFSPGRLVGLPHLDDLAQVGVFYDYASLRQPYYPKDIVSGNASNGTLPFDLASSGVLLRYSISRNISINLDAGWQLKTAPASNKLGNYAAFAVILSN